MFLKEDLKSVSKRGSWPWSFAGFACREWRLANRRGIYRVQDWHQALCGHNRKQLGSQLANRPRCLWESLLEWHKYFQEPLLHFDLKRKTIWTWKELPFWPDPRSEDLTKRPLTRSDYTLLYCTMRLRPRIWVLIAEKVEDHSSKR